MSYVKIPLKSVLIKMDLAMQNTQTKSCYFVNPSKAQFGILLSVRISLEHQTQVMEYIRRIDVF